eukprot:6490753-Amphidinium_carterae.2
MSSTDKLKAFADIGNMRSIQRDSFIPGQWENNIEQHLWWTWLTEAQMHQYIEHGTVPGFKELHGDNVQRHHMFHNRVDHCLNLAIHCRWNSCDKTHYQHNKPIALMVWRKSIDHIRRSVTACGMYSSSIYF